MVTSLSTPRPSEETPCAFPPWPLEPCPSCPRPDCWVTALFVLGGVMGAAGTDYRSEFTLPDVESARGFDIIDENFGGAGGGQTGSIVFPPTRASTIPRCEQAMEAYFAEVDAIPDVTVVSPYGTRGARQVSQAGDDAGQVAFAQVEVPQDMSFEESTEVGNQWTS